MNRYFLDLKDRVWLRDVTGIVLSDDSAALEMARSLAKRLVKHRAEAIHWQLVIKNDADEVVAESSMFDLIRESRYPETRQG